MSHDATNWASKQRGIKPALKVVLWQLCDRYHPDNGCFPSQETLAADCEVSRSALNVYLDELEERGLIMREQRREKGSNRQERTRYRFPFEAGFVAKSAENPCPDSGHGSGEAVSGNDAEPSPENGESRVQNLDSNPVREPVNEPVREREARERERSGEDLKALEKRFDALMIGKHGNPWPGVLSKSKEWAFRQFLNLAPEERLIAEDRRDDYLAACPKINSGPRKGAPDAAFLGIYLKDKLFLLVDAVAPKAVARNAERQRAAEHIAVAPFGPVWGGARALALLKGPVRIEMPANVREAFMNSFEIHLRQGVPFAARWAAKRGVRVDDAGNPIFPEDFERQEYRRRLLDLGYPEVSRLHEAAKQRGQVSVAATFERLKDLCEAVPVGSDMWERWRIYHEEQGWPFVPTPAAMKVVFFPKGGPDGLSAFERAANAVLGVERGDDDAIQEG